MRLDFVPMVCVLGSVVLVIAHVLIGFLSR